jgi:hypothetical protein
MNKTIKPLNDQTTKDLPSTENVTQNFLRPEEDSAINKTTRAGEELVANTTNNPEDLATNETAATIDQTATETSTLNDTYTSGTSNDEQSTIKSVSALEEQTKNASSSVSDPGIKVAEDNNSTRKPPNPENTKVAGLVTNRETTEAIEKYGTPNTADLITPSFDAKSFDVTKSMAAYRQKIESTKITVTDRLPATEIDQTKNGTIPSLWDETTIDPSGIENGTKKDRTADDDFSTTRITMAMEKEGLGNNNFTGDSFVEASRTVAPSEKIRPSKAPVTHHIMAVRVTPQPQSEGMKTFIRLSFKRECRVWPTIFNPKNAEVD